MLVGFSQERKFMKKVINSIQMHKVPSEIKMTYVQLKINFNLIILDMLV